MSEKLNGFYTRKLRRAIAKTEGQPFEPQYNGKAPITFTEYLLNFKTDMAGNSVIPRRLRTSPLNKFGKAKVAQ